MLVGYDPVARTTIIDINGMVLPIEVSTETLFTKFYGDSGVGVATLCRDGVALEYSP